MLAGCAADNAGARHFLESKDLTRYDSQSFYHCYNSGCSGKSLIKLQPQEWEPIDRLFTPAKIAHAESERKALQKAIAMLESLSGQIAQTAGDKGGTFEAYGGNGPRQQDCIDESLNSTIYLETLHRRGLLRFHTVRPPSARVPLLNAVTWPHQTAVIAENKDGTLWAVDSWFHDNGQPPEIVKLSDWKSGWRPAQTP